MLRRFWNWLRGVKPSGAYAPEERLIFTFFNGVKEVQADPLRLWRRVMAQAETLRISAKLANSASKDADQGAVTLAKTCREIFAIPEESTEIDATGTLTDDQVCAVFDRFMTYIHDVKKKSKSTLTLPNSSAATTTTSPTAQPTNSSSASSSVATVPTCVVPQPPPSPTASPCQPMA